MHGPLKHSSAFTLIELLAAVAVLGILAALLIPIVPRAQERAQRAKCAGNLRQIAAALFQYAGENNNQLPAVSTEWPPNSSEPTWGRAIWSYAGYSDDAFGSPDNDLAGATGVDRNIFHCPATKRKPTPTPLIASANANRYSYGLNAFPLTKTLGWVAAYKTSPLVLSTIETPSQTAMVNETSFCLGGYEGYYQYHGLVPHGGGSNVLFYDGHAEWRPFAQIPSSASHPFWR